MRSLLLATVLVVEISSFCLPASAAEPTYAKPDLLVEPAALEAMLGKDNVVVLHAAAARMYDRARVPGALLVDVPAWKKAFGDGTDAAGWSKRIGDLGIGPRTRVVVYDEGGATSAARMWWILQYWGVERAAILNGGLRGWIAHAGAKQPGAKPVEAKPVAFEAKPHPNRLRTTEQMIDLANNASELIIDTRSRDEVAAGAIGHAAERCEWIECFDQETGRFKKPADLTKLLRLDRFHQEDPQPVVTYCRSGGRASVTAFALELMGVENVANYYGSWSAWEKRDAAR